MIIKFFKNVKKRDLWTYDYQIKHFCNIFTPSTIIMKICFIYLVRCLILKNNKYDYMPCELISTAINNVHFKVNSRRGRPIAIYQKAINEYMNPLIPSQSPRLIFNPCPADHDYCCF